MGPRLWPGMRSIGALGVCLLSANPTALGAQIPEAAPCVTCHLDQDEERLVAPARDFPTDIHAERGFGCLACHGKLGDHGPEPAVGFLSKPERRDIPRLCASCHADAAFMRDYNPSIRVDQLTEYESSVHGRLLFSENDPDVATCTSCHPAHGIRPPSDAASTVHPLNVADLCGSCHADAELMEARGHSSDQLEEYKRGIHGQLLYETGDLSAPTCNDCHGNHGAAPPGIASVANVCGECHVQMGELFQESAHGELFAEADLPGCATCHGNHDIAPPHDEFLLDVSRDVCMRCHTAGEEVGGEFEAIREILGTFEQDVAGAQARLDEAEVLGMEVSQAQFELDGVNTALTLARTAVHSFRIEPVQGEIDKGKAVVAAALSQGDEALDEHRFRRVGLGVSASLMALVVLLLIFKIRGIDARLRGTALEAHGFFSRHILDPNQSGADPSEQGLTVAASAVLYELAMEDRRLRDSLGQIRERCTSAGGQAVVAELLALIDKQHREAMDPGQFARLISRRFSESQKVGVVSALRPLVAGVSELNVHEHFILGEVLARLALSPLALKDLLAGVGEAGGGRQ